MRFVLSLALILIGGLISYLGWWLLLHISNEKLQRRFRHSWKPRIIKVDEEAYLQANIALVGMMVMIIGTLMLLGGVAKLFGLSD